MGGLSPSDLPALLARGVETFNAGDVAAAEKCFRDVLAADAANADALHLLGLCRHRAGDSAGAIACITDALRGAPANATFLNNLGQIYAAVGRLDDAAERYREAIAAEPSSPQAYNNLGNVLARLGETEAAARHYRSAIGHAPTYAVAHYNLGTLLLDGGDADGAAAAFRRVLELDPAYAEAHNNLGQALETAGDLDGAAGHYQSALALHPRFAEAFNNMGNVHKKRGDLEAAVRSYGDAIGINPRDPSPHTNLGVVRAMLGDVDEALATHRKAIEIAPDHPEAHHNLGLALLLSGRLPEAWAEYEWRLGIPCRKTPDRLPETRWRGEALAGKRILVWGEQGVGDEVMFAGMVPDLLETGASVVLENDPRLRALLQRSFPGARCVQRQEPPASDMAPDAFDFHTPSGSLGRWLRPTLDTFPPRRSYLVADAGRRDELRARYLQGSDDRLVGIAWYSKNPNSGRYKSMSLMELRPLAATPGIRLVDLQYGDTAEERRAFAEETGVSVIHDERVDQMADLDAFAAQVAAMDVVVSVSNTTVHMAGALGVPTWVMLQHVPLSCWMLEREDSPWYPSARLFRQSRAGRWDDVVARVSAELAAPGG